jgi:ABC-type multidrug transport system fused ATPase/permease subunit
MEECLRIQSDARQRGRLARFIGATPLHPDARSWYQGAIGELEVARVQADLGPEWTVLHAIPVGTGSSDIDHLLVGPPGIFTINTKNHDGKKVWVGGGSLMVDGHRTEHLRNARFEADRAARTLAETVGSAVHVTPIIVVVGAASLSHGRKDSHVLVLRSTELLRWLQTQKRQLSETTVEYFATIAELRATWTARTEAEDDTARHLQRFQRLRAEVIAAGRRARWFRVGGGLASGAAAVAAASYVLPAVLNLALHL